MAASNVSARQPWVDTGVDLKAGDALTISATGQWTNGGNPVYYADADGFKGVLYDQAELTTANFVALIGKVGDQVFLVGSAYKGTSPGTGRLYLQINDGPGAAALADNAGEMVVEIQHQASVPEATGGQERVLAVDPHEGYTGYETYLNEYRLEAAAEVPVRGTALAFRSPRMKSPDSQGIISVSVDGMSWHEVGGWTPASVQEAYGRGDWHRLSLERAPQGLAGRTLLVRFQYQAGAERLNTADVRWV